MPWGKAQKRGRCQCELGTEFPAATLAFLERHRGFGTAVAAHSVPPSPISAGRMHRLMCRSPDFHRGATRGCWPRPAAAAATACKSVGCEPFMSKGPLGVREAAMRMRWLGRSRLTTWS